MLLRVDRERARNLISRQLALRRSCLHSPAALCTRTRTHALASPSAAPAMDDPPSSQEWGSSQDDSRTLGGDSAVAALHAQASTVEYDDDQRLSRHAQIARMPSASQQERSSEEAAQASKR